MRAPGRAWPGLVVLVLALAAGSGGCAIPRNGVPVGPDVPVTHVVTAAGPLEIRERYYPGQGTIRHAVATGQPSRRRPPPKRPDGSVGYDLLALSGGGSNGAFGAGVLCGWTKAGTRPTFQIVTGVSAGSLLSSFAFAGPQFDDRLHALFTTMSNDQVFERNNLLRLPWSDSLARTEPLAELIRFQVDSQLLAAVAQGDREGRRLYVGTTHLDHKRLIIWDMGSIASSGHPGAAELYARVLLASSSIPVVFNPVEFQVRAGGQLHSELHVDGGARSQVFLRSVLVKNLDPAASAQGGSTLDESEPDPVPEPAPPPVAGTAIRRIANLTGTRLYVLVNGKLQADPTVTKRVLLPIASQSLSALMYAKSSADILRLYYLATATGMDYRLIAIPQDARNVPPSAEFDTARMTAIFQLGDAMARSDSSWARAPRGLDENEFPGYDRDVAPPTAPAARRPDRDADSDRDTMTTRAGWKPTPAAQEGRRKTEPAVDP